MWRLWSVRMAAAIALAAAAATPSQLVPRHEPFAQGAPTQITLAFDDGVSLRVEHGDLIVTLRL